MCLESGSPTMHFSSTNLRLLYPYFDFAFYSDSLLGLHQVDLRLDLSVVVEVEFFSYGVFESGHADVFYGANFIPEVALDFRSFFGVVEF
jgi:hypothetical protein